MDAIYTEWQNPEKTIICITLHDGWSWDDLYDALDKVKHMAVTVPHNNLGLIFNMEDTSYHPSGVDKHLGRIISNIHPNVIYFLMVGTNFWLTGIHRVMVEVNTELAEYYRLMPTLDEAHRFLKNKLSVYANARSRK